MIKYDILDFITKDHRQPVPVAKHVMPDEIIHRAAEVNYKDTDFPFGSSSSKPVMPSPPCIPYFDWFSPAYIEPEGLETEDGAGITFESPF